MSSSTSSSDSEFEDTPSDITAYTTIIATDNLPEKSRHLYEKCYQDFIEWREASSEPKTFSENVLLAHFKECSNELKPSTLWTRYSMLRSMLSIKHQVNISAYSNLLGFLKKNSKGFKGKKAKTFTPEEIKRFLDEAPLKYLLMKVALIIGVMGACRRYELYELQFDAFTVLESSIVVTIPNRKTKRGRTFTITGKYVAICKDYIKLRPKNCKSPRFLLNYVNEKCTDQHIGINKLGSLGKIIATYLELPNPSSYTGHCFRRSSASILIDAGGDITAVTRHALHRVSSVEQNKTSLLQQSTAVPATLTDKLPVFMRNGKKWLIEYQKGNSNLVVENADMSNVVHMYRCGDSALTVRGKVNGVVLDSCTKCAVVFDHLISSIEFMNCQSVQMQVLGKVPMIFIDNTDGCQIYLSSESLDVEIVSSKSSLMNVLVPQGNGEYTELPIPEQFKTVVNQVRDGLLTTPVEKQVAESRWKSLRDRYMEEVEESKVRREQAELSKSAWSLRSFLRDSASSRLTHENGQQATETSNVKEEYEIDFVDVQENIKPDTENTSRYLPDTTHSTFPVPKAPVSRLSPGPSPSTSISISPVASPLQTRLSPLPWPSTSSAPPSKRSKKDKDAFVEENRQSASLQGAAPLTSEDHFFMSIAKDSQVLTSFRKIQLRSFVLNKLLELMQEQGVQ